MPDRMILEACSDSLAMKYGARNAITKSLAITETDVVVLICDETTVSIGAALLREIDAVGATAHCFVLEKHVTRPTGIVPGAIERAMLGATASIYAVLRQPNEFGHRGRLLELAGANKLRHAHMVDITESSMQQGMLADATKIARLNDFIIEKLGNAPEARITSAAGTDLRVTFRSREPFYGSSGVITPDRWENLPTGEIYTVPESVDGLYVCDNAFSVPDSSAHHDRFALGANPIKLKFEKGHLTALEGGPDDLGGQFYELVRAGTNLDRCGLFGIGTNFELLMPLGNCIQDLNLPGAYISLGRAAGDVSTFDWTSSSQYLFVGRQLTVTVGGVEIVCAGKFDTNVIGRVTTSAMPSGPSH